MWADEERRILHLTIAGDKHRLDPMPMLRRYRLAVKKIGSEAFQSALQQITSGGEAADTAAALVLPVVKEALQFPTFAEDAEKGYTEEELLTAFVQFLEFMATSKKKDASLPSSAGSAGDSAETQPTTNISDLSSAATLLSQDAPGASPAV